MNTPKIERTIDSRNWLLHFPIMFFASVMGIGGLTLVIGKTIRIFELEVNFSWLLTALSFFSVFLLCGISILYLAKIIRHYSAFSKELKHPVRINFFLCCLCISFDCLNANFTLYSLVVCSYYFFILVLFCN